MTTTDDMKTLVELAREGKKARERRGWWERLWAVVLVRLFLLPGHAWLLMIGVGVIHGVWIPALPTIGYWWAVLVMVLVEAIWPPRIPAAKS